MIAISIKRCVQFVYGSVVRNKYAGSENAEAMRKKPKPGSMLLNIAQRLFCIKCWLSLQCTI